MKIKITIIAFALLIAPVMGFTQNGAALPDPGLTPESPFYFLDRWGEGLQDFFTFNPENKTRLQLAFVAERTAEFDVMLARDRVNQRAVGIALERMSSHNLRLGEIIQRIDIPAKEVFVAELTRDADSFRDILGTIIKENKGRIEGIIELENQRIEARFNEAAFVTAMEGALQDIAARIDQELGLPLTGFEIVSQNIDFEGDTYSATYRATAAELKDLEVLRARILAGGIADRWESGDVVLDDDSLDITFEKIYEEFNIEAETMFPYVSVTISITLNSPERGMTAINYNIDITLESESENLLDFLEEQKERLEDEYDVLSDALEEQMSVLEATSRAIREAEKEKQELIDEAQGEGVTLPANAFAAFDNLLLLAQSALQAGNYQEAKLLARQAEDELENIEQLIEDLAEQKELREEAEAAIEEAEAALSEIEQEARKAGVVLPVAELGQFNNLLSQSRSAFAAASYKEAQQLAKRAEGALEDVAKRIEQLIEAKERQEELNIEARERQLEERREPQEGREGEIRQQQPPRPVEEERQPIEVEQPGEVRYQPEGRER